MAVTDFLSEYPAFKNFEQSDFDNLATVCTEQNYKKDEVICAEETPGDKMFIIKAGSVKVLKKVKEKETTLAVLNKGDFTGDMAVLDGSNRSATLKSAMDTKLLVIQKKVFEDFKQKYTVSAIKLLDILVKGLSQRLRSANKNIEAISFWVE